MSQDALAKRIRKLQRQKKNRLCFDCGDRGPNNVCIPFGIFVCDQCAGVHRSFSHRIKGISMSRWSEEEVSDIEEKGNIAGSKVYLKGWDEDSFPRPDSNDKRAIKDWIKVVYEEKRFAKKKKKKVKKTKKKKTPKKSEQDTVVKDDDDDDWAAFDNAEENNEADDDDDWSAFDKVETRSSSSKSKASKKKTIEKQNSDDAWDPFNGGGSAPAAETTSTATNSNKDEFAGFADAFADTGSNQKTEEKNTASSDSNADKITDVFASLSFSETTNTKSPSLPPQNGFQAAGMMMGGSNPMGGNTMMMTGNNVMQQQQRMMMMNQNGGGMMMGPMGGMTTSTTTTTKKKTPGASGWQMDIGSDLLPFKSKPQATKPPAPKVPAPSQHTGMMMMGTPGMMTMPQQNMMMPQRNMMMMGNNMMQQQHQQMMMGQNAPGMMMMGQNAPGMMMTQQQVKPQQGDGFNPFDSPANTQQKVPQQQSSDTPESNNPFDMF